METYVSILNCDFLKLGEELKKLDGYEINGIQVDIMDGSFVEDVTYGWNTVKAIVQNKGLCKPVEIHLMVDKPEIHLHKYIAVNPERIILHSESTNYLRKNPLEIKANNIKYGIALKLDSPLNEIEHALDLVDSVLIISCDEGFGGNKFQDIAVNKIKSLQKIKESYNLAFEISVDGGITNVTAKKVVNFGVK